MSELFDLVQKSRGRRSTVDNARKRLLSAKVRDGLQEQWRHAARNDSRVFLHAFDQKEGKEWYLTGWDGQDTVAALTNDGFRNVPLHELRGAKIDGGWDDKTILYEVKKDHTCVSDSTASVTRTRYDPFDAMFSNYLEVSGQSTNTGKNRKIVGETTKHRLVENKTVPKWIVGVSDRGGKSYWYAAKSYEDMPIDYLPVEVVRAIDEEAAIRQAQELVDTEQVDMTPKGGVSPFIRNAYGIQSLEEMFGW